MKIENGTLLINPTIPQTDLEVLYSYVKENLNNFKRVEFENDEPIATSGLISLIVSLQKSDSQLEVDLIKKEEEITLAGIGLCEFNF
jgi:translation elongation factor EF-1beta